MFGSTHDFLAHFLHLDRADHPQLRALQLQCERAQGLSSEFAIEVRQHGMLHGLHRSESILLIPSNLLMTKELFDQFWLTGMLPTV
jgi:hypothetical protein